MTVLVLFGAGLLLACGCFSLKANASTCSKMIKEFRPAAKRFNVTLTVPDFEKTPEDVKTTVAATLAEADASLDRLGSQDTLKVTFESSVRALDDVIYQVSTVAARIDVIKNASMDPKVREACEAVEKSLQDWSVKVEYREDVYRVLKAYEQTKPQLTGEDARLLEDTLRDYRRAGFALTADERKEVERLRKELVGIGLDFENNIRNAKAPIVLSKAELEGVPEEFLASVKTGDDTYTINANNAYHFSIVRENARVEETRRRLQAVKYSIAQEVNVPLMKKMVTLRADIANRLGYQSWADYRIEVKMAKTGETARRFETELSEKLEPKFTAELEQMRTLKVKDTGDPNAKIKEWDAYYYWNEIQKKDYGIDTEALRVYFPIERVLGGMFDIYQTIFRLKIEQIEPPYKWSPDLRLYMVSDSKTGEPLGMFYLDLFPREGKYNHFAQFGIIEGKRLPNGSYQRPTVALICNFPPPEGDKPSLLTHDDVVTIFHEFGHALHSILTRAEYARFSGTSVPRDFVEVPSQTLESWVWDMDVLNRFAADYRDPSKKIPEEILKKMKAAKIATIGGFYRRQLAFGLLDLAIHMPDGNGADMDVVRVTNDILGKIFLAPPANTAFIGTFTHLAGGYDGGYYGYAWADVIAADMASIFEESPGRFMNPDVGLRLREEIYARGNSRDVNESIRAFLGRDFKMDAFLKKLGLDSKK